MKIQKRYLEEIVKEELANVVQESVIQFTSNAFKSIKDGTTMLDDIKDPPTRKLICYILSILANEDFKDCHSGEGEKK